MKIKKRTIVNIILIILLMPPNGIEQINVLNQASKIIGSIAGVYLLIPCFRDFKKYKSLVWVLIMMIFETISTIANGGGYDTLCMDDAVPHTIRRVCSSSA